LFPVGRVILMCYVHSGAQLVPAAIAYMYVYEHVPIFETTPTCNRVIMAHRFKSQVWWKSIYIVGTYAEN